MVPLVRRYKYLIVHDRRQGLSKNSGNNNIEYNMTSYLWRSDPGSEHTQHSREVFGVASKSSLLEQCTGTYGSSGAWFPIGFVTQLLSSRMST